MFERKPNFKVYDPETNTDVSSWTVAGEDGQGNVLVGQKFDPVDKPETTLVSSSRIITQRNVIASLAMEGHFDDGPREIR